MRRRRRLRIWAKWMCTLAATLVVGAAVVSIVRTVVYIPGNGKVGRLFVMVGGKFVFLHADSLDDVGVFMHNDSVLGVGNGWSMQDSSPWSWGMSGVSVGERWRGGIIWVSRSSPNGWGVAGVTLLYPFLLTALPAGILWYKDRCRYEANACQKCGYDRRGLTADAKCPECGGG